MIFSRDFNPLGSQVLWGANGPTPYINGASIAIAAREQMPPEESTSHMPPMEEEATLEPTALHGAGLLGHK